jgi:hypothetical protein
MERACSSETLVSTYKSTRRYNPGDQHRHFYRRENLKSQVTFYINNDGLQYYMKEQARKIDQSQPCITHQLQNTPHLNPEDGGKMYRRNVCIWRNNPEYHYMNSQGHENLKFYIKKMTQKCNF